MLPLHVHACSFASSSSCCWPSMKGVAYTTIGSKFVPFAPYDMCMYACCMRLSLFVHPSGMAYVSIFNMYIIIP